jgi:hypothetical protein
LEESNSGAREKGQAQLIALFLLLALVPTTVIVAQNATNSTGVEGFITEVNLTEEIAVEEILNESAPEIPEEHPEIPEENVTEELPEENVTIEIPEVNITELEDNTTVLEENETVINETNVTLPEENITIPEANVTLPEENVSQSEENITISNETTTETNVTLPEEPEENVTYGPQEAELVVEMITPERITRDYDVTLTAVVENVGNETANDVVLEWDLPEFFVVFLGNVEEDIGVLEPGSSFTSEITVAATTDAVLGPSEVKVRLSYE